MWQVQSSCLMCILINYKTLNYTDVNHWRIYVFSLQYCDIINMIIWHSATGKRSEASKIKLKDNEQYCAKYMPGTIRVTKNL